jgi:hypothetical protein
MRGMASEKRFAVRTIRNGEVRIGGKVFRPGDKGDRPYDGRLDGLRMAFGQYPGFTFSDGLKRVSLWGTERAYRCRHDHDADGTEWCDWPGPNCIDGTFYWDSWTEVAS